MRVRSIVTAIAIAAPFTLIASGNALASEQGYARFCTTMTPGVARGAHYRNAMQRTHADETSAAQSGAAIAAAVQSRLKLASPPTVVERDLQQIIGPYRSVAGAPNPEIVLLADLDPTEPRYWTATLAADGSVAGVVPADAHAHAFQGVGFMREMAAYALLNDVLGGDDPLPREGCAALDAAWFASAPPVIGELQRAASTVPTQDAALSGAVRDSWNALSAAGGGTGEGSGLTEDTLRKIGKDPLVTLVYRDPGLPGDTIGEIDAVRIGAKIHTYAMVANARPIKLGDAPLCVVGDLRCGRFYEWP